MGSVLGNGRGALSEEVPVGYKRTEVGVIPEDWNAVLLGEGVSAKLCKRDYCSMGTLSP